MKKIVFFIVIFLSSLVFCTKDNSLGVSTDGGYRDSIIVDLFSYDVYAAEIDKPYIDSIIITDKGKAFLKPRDPNFKSKGKELVIVPKYKPSKFEAWLYDSVPLISFDLLDSTVLAKAYTMSSNYFYRIDTSQTSDDRCIKQIDLTYDYGDGFVLGFISWGIGVIKIYYK
jgi:hypothetical protein